MATTKPRITITLSDKTHRLLRAISDCSNQPMSTFVNEMLESAAPTLERMAATFQRIKQAQDGQRKQFLADIDQAQAAIEPVVMETLGQFDLFLGKIEQAADRSVTGMDGAAGRRGSGLSAAAASPPTNRGDTPHEGKGSKPKRDKASRPVLKKRAAV